MEQQIEQRTTPKFTVITIVNWDSYQKEEQQKEQQRNNRGTTEEQQRNTYKNVKNVKNVKKERAHPPTLLLDRKHLNTFPIYIIFNVRI